MVYIKIVLDFIQGLFVFSGAKGTNNRAGRQGAQDPPPLLRALSDRVILSDSRLMLCSNIFPCAVLFVAF